MGISEIFENHMESFATLAKMVEKIFCRISFANFFNPTFRHCRFFPPPEKIKKMVSECLLVKKTSQNLITARLNC